MIRRKLLIVVAAAMWAVVPATARANAANCVAPTVSALNQYCENIPAATGGQSPGPGEPSVATTLAPKVVREIARTGPLSAKRKLVTLPAAGPRHPLRRSSAAIRTTTTPGSSPGLLLFLTLAGITLALLAATVQRRRHRSRLAAEVHG